MFRAMIRDRAALHRAMQEILTWDFDRVIVGHGEAFETGGKQRLAEIVSSVER
ncbi:MAG: hypothetical protein H0V56_05200 [Chthoniobacterales bacterium]|nr:hypothetical protein [Chthoniobacterales bacterium]